MSNDIKSLINDNPMTGFQIFAIGMCALINMLDGFDVLVMAFTASSIGEEWGLSGKSLGTLFSSGLAGMAIGAMFLSSYADVYGRRNLILFCLAIITLGMLLSSLTQSLQQLAACRLLTGIGIGGALASVNIITAEYSSNKRRGLAIATVQTGYPLGGIIGGGVAALLISESGWRSVFVFGGALSLIMIPIVMLRLPESIDYLLHKRPKDSLEKINKVIQKMGYSAISELPAVETTSTQLKASVKSLWLPRYRSATILMWTGFFMVMASLYFVLSWTPKLLEIAGLSKGQGISGGMILHIGGISGQLFLGYIAGRFKLRKVMVVYMFLATVFTCVFGFFSDNLSVSMYLAGVSGFFSWVQSQDCMR